MAWANIPPHGAMHDALVREKLIKQEQTCIDPVMRYKLREHRLQDELISATNGLIRQAEQNAKLYRKITKEYK